MFQPCNELNIQQVIFHHFIQVRHILVNCENVVYLHLPVHLFDQRLPCQISIKVLGLTDVDGF